MNSVSCLVKCYLYYKKNKNLGNPDNNKTEDVSESIKEVQSETEQLENKPIRHKKIHKHKHTYKHTGDITWIRNKPNSISQLEPFNEITWIRNKPILPQISQFENTQPEPILEPFNEIGNKPILSQISQPENTQPEPINQRILIKPPEIQRLSNPQLLLNDGNVTVRRNKPIQKKVYKHKHTYKHTDDIKWIRNKPSLISQPENTQPEPILPFKRIPFLPQDPRILIEPPEIQRLSNPQLFLNDGNVTVRRNKPIQKKVHKHKHTYKHTDDIKWIRNKPSLISQPILSQVSQPEPILPFKRIPFLPQDPRILIEPPEIQRLSNPQLFLNDGNVTVRRNKPRQKKVNFSEDVSETNKPKVRKDSPRGRMMTRNYKKKREDYLKKRERGFRLSQY